ncbi:uncharacterized protein LOC143620269 [Bidens hawaiensis]|uniref:uncharacterized protein LOC143620269 n=1 Tax=Bidens hawaiensis TaxID=980011 RepID=UPI00404937EE
MAGDDETAGGIKNVHKTIDPSSPYYIHTSDYPRQMQVNDLLNDTNYNDWCQEMTNFLFAKNKMGFVDGSMSKPDQTKDKYMAWLRCDAMIKGWLTTTMKKDIRGSVKYANTSFEIWSDLRERFGKESEPQAYELKQSLTMTRQDGSSVSTYYTKLRSLWDEIQTVLPPPRCNCGNCTCDIGKKVTEFKDKERLYEFLMGLDIEFTTIRTHLLSMKPTPTLGEAYRLTSEDEQQRGIATAKRSQTDSVAFQTGLHGRRDNGSRQKYKGGMKDAKCNSEADLCTHCGKTGHVKDACFERIGYPDWWPGKAKREKGKLKA